VDKIKNNPKFIINMAPGSVMGLVQDSGNPKSPFADIRVRRAVAYALDTTTMLKVAGYGYFTACNQIFPAASWANNPKIAGYPYNPEKAKQLMVEAGYANGLETKIYYESTITTGVPEMVQSYLAKIGINTKLEKITTALFAQYQSKGWENAMLSNVNFPWNVGTDPGNSLKQRLSGEGAYNTSVLFPRDYQTKLAQANAEVDFGKRSQMLQEISKMIIDDYAMIVPYWQENILAAIYAEVKDAHYRDCWSMQWTPENVWLSK
jgi:ABC-type transport system substrate-binding protein